MNHSPYIISVSVLQSIDKASVSRLIFRSGVVTGFCSSRIADEAANCLMSQADFEAVRSAQAERNQAAGRFKHESSQRPESGKGISFNSVSDELYENYESKYDGYARELPQDGDEEEQEIDGQDTGSRRLVGNYTAPKHLLNEFANDDQDTDIIQDKNTLKQISARESDYQKRRFDRALSPGRKDAFAGETNGTSEAQSYKDVMRQREQERDDQRLREEVEQRRLTAKLNGTEDDIDHATHKAALTEKDQAISQVVHGDLTPPRVVVDGDKTPPRTRKRRWDVATKTEEPDISSEVNTALKLDPSVDQTTKRSRWDETPVPVNGASTKRSRWDQTPAPGSVSAKQVTAPAAVIPTSFGTDVAGRNLPLSDEELDELLPKTGYKILIPPPGFEPIRAPAKRVQVEDADGGFVMPDLEQAQAQAKAINDQLPTDIPGVGDLQFFKQEDMKYFGKLMDTTDENQMSVDELKERKIMRLILKVKNGAPPMRKSALRQLTDKAREFGADPLFKQILPVLMERTLEDQERHLLVKIIDRILYKLDDLVRPWVHRILVVIEPLLIDEDFYARVEGREIISNLSKAAGLAHMISTMRPDIDHVDEYVRNTTARAFSVVASALGIPAILPFLKAVCKSKKSWQARHTGVKIIQQIAILMGCAVLPHLKNLVECIAPGLEDEQQKVRTITALAVAALAEAAAPYGIESFDTVLKPIWTGIRKHRGKGLAAFLKAAGYIIPLMDPEWADHFTNGLMTVLTREFSSPDEEMKKIVLKVVSQCAATEGVTQAFLRAKVMPDFFKNFWVRRMALDRRNYRQVVETTVELAQKVGVHEIVDRIVDNLKDESEPYRKMAVETIEKVIAIGGASEITDRLEERLIDGILYAFQEQSIEDPIMLNGFGTVVNSLGIRCKPYLPQIVSTILWRLNNKSAKVRQQSADLISRIAIVMKTCGEEQLMGKLGVVLYEYLGEEYPEVLGSILGALKSIVNVVGMTSMTPPIKDLLPRLTPILRNRHEKVQENTIDLVGRIADRGSEFVSAREWMRICFELLDMLKAHKKGIRRAAVNTFGYIAKAIGPSDVLATLLNNLRVQERQNRVCTTVAIAIVAETCAPFTVVPALMAEYRVPELNVRTGVLKSLSFMFEYIGEMGRDYVYAISPLLEDALTDRDQVHRQTSATVIKHLSLGVVGLGCEDLMVHLLNLIWPNIFETSPHVINAMTDAISGIRTAVGPGVLMNYLLNGLFHPARKVRTVYTKLYNDMYVQQAASMVPYYPLIESDDRNTWYKHSAMVWI
ncbi:putative Splicing factor 3B subunit 1 [Taphrina deformans PYCC 5710]|uniref:Splicing factor 3B subunit 1 n=1 Tax=Taphrina deformans (strain PYCC 5710 / ATCC 11124 / CBS 356.35 / IMI 108563 / JCM 9778 / NBRC 8474) TaxID=1097556 RepID=R4X700_TAPDE|nr:putative Splicing factor 3B subunit 1 [Taphrina deformans PYCC 5710]|eukprot:CCG81011.1 putative Splicing factor 3B subunit 1 [Taphrina deformans PYCC 5710]